MKKVFFAIDEGVLSSAIASIDPIKEHLLGIKIGLQFFLAEGINGVKQLSTKFPSLAIFLDLKLHDIPNTVGAAMESLFLGGVFPDYMTVHAAGGEAMIRKAHAIIHKHKAKTKLLGVTLLTSLDQDDLDSMGLYGGRDKELVKSLAKMAMRGGCDGVVCSPWEVLMVRRSTNEKFLIITPGIRIGAQGMGDQKRIATPEEAIEAGANFLVLGRSLRSTSDKIALLEHINNIITAKEGMMGKAPT